MGFISEIFGYLLNFLYNLVNNYGVAILIFSVVLRIVLIPITIKQQKSMKKNAQLQEEMKEIQRKYKNNPEKLNQETIDLYKREKMSPFSGCLSSILQIIIILSVFWLVSQPLTYMKRINPETIDKYTTEMAEANYNPNNNYRQIALLDYAESKYNEVENSIKEIDAKLNEENVENREELLQNKAELEKQKEEYNSLRLNTEFLGLDLSKVPTQSLNDWKVYVIPVLYVISSIASIKLTMITQKKKNEKENKDIIIENKEEEKINKNENITDKEEKIKEIENKIEKIKEERRQEEDPMDQMQQMSNSMMYTMPIMSVMIAIIAPLGLALYWLASNILMIIERLVINKISDIKDKKEENING